ncbi:hypothetical protein [Nocardioides sp.]|uniref:DUF6414 family protein n=1 Tax=Nocardioides sp. TaxID=35761 RepID=UPI0019B6704E|nr:hypothetical protein [Nocardioides sp.]MBC7276703.1 hypothetical protein [Nocardioides sp.]
MPNNLPGSDIPDVREYIYVDTDRVTSLLAQMYDGLPTEQETKQSRSSKLQANVTILRGERGRDDAESEKLALADLHTSMLEEAAYSLGLLRDVSEDPDDKARRPKSWLRGQVRNLIKPGMLLRVTAPTILIDPHYLVGTFRRLEAFGDTEDAEFEGILKLIEAIYGNEITLNIRPTVDPRDAFVGTIPHDHGFKALSRDLLLNRMGADPTEVTAVVQIARIPTERDKTQDQLMNELEDIGRRFDQLSPDTLDRQVIDDMISKMGALIESAGLAAAPKWPAISVIPLALYRNVLPAPVGALFLERNKANAPKSITGGGDP